MALQRVYPILDTTTLTHFELDLVTTAEAMLEGGARILQLRHKGVYSRAIYSHAARIAELCRAAGARFVINDRADIAMLTGAGLHVGQHDLAPADARRLLGPDALIGYSTHNPEQLAEAAGEPVDYLALGPIFATRSKENPDPVLGLEGLRDAAPRVRLPLVAIGGITRENAEAAFAAGAASVAVIGDLIPAKPDFRAVRERMEEWQRLVMN